ncbi:DUF4435 domain-containing protein [Morganella morganii]|uniref:DUF4435 domain-containing protein n=1 Tax=Morganella morganii TaxID=582 RepID=UPI001BDB8C53|nr:DUF4435 domain-containing protein [Morganella morganii]MBT0484724.1 DUF4435 domain-containing protein [Morganella morganii subsp. morganii]
MIDDRFEMMMQSIKKPCVLRLKLIKNKTPGKLLFVFEGNDDYDYYYHLMNRHSFDKEFTHINGLGKDQSIALYEELLSEGSDSLNATCFFVDQDYSLFCYRNKNIFTLPFYAIENPLSDEKVIKHFLTSEFRFDEYNKNLIEKVLDYYRQAKSSFYTGIKYISVQLYMARILGLGIEFPTNSDLFLSISKNSVTFKITEIPEITKRLNSMTDDEKNYFKTITELDEDKLTRGKYVYHFVTEWLMKIKKYINDRINSANASGTETDKPLASIAIRQYDYRDLSIARLSPSCGRLEEINTFLSNI